MDVSRVRSSERGHEIFSEFVIGDRNAVGLFLNPLRSRGGSESRLEIQIPCLLKYEGTENIEGRRLDSNLSSHFQFVA